VNVHAFSAFLQDSREATRATSASASPSVLLPSIACERMTIERLTPALVAVAVVVPRSGAKSPGLKAIDPLTGKTKWENGSDMPRFSGVLSTARGLVFSGQLTGEFEAFDADTGKKLWQFLTGSGIEGQPVTWEQDGVQYIAVASGYGGVYSLFSGDARLASVPAGGSLWVFALAPQ
jgi:outer membrane protein assembly factor BamB